MCACSGAPPPRIAPAARGAGCARWGRKYAEVFRCLHWPPTARHSLTARQAKWGPSVPSAAQCMQQQVLVPLGLAQGLHGQSQLVQHGKAMTARAQARSRSPAITAAFAGTICGRLAGVTCGRLPPVLLSQT
mmetsp:Transcript_66304/g.183587  ORF Transcript_66304/g.183587 Transcript_66304/m.183587 type:complete len:132 (+) Transcript_66304:50-445(+)